MTSKKEIIELIDSFFPCDLYNQNNLIGSFRTFNELRSKDRIMYNEIIDFIRYDPIYSTYTFKNYGSSEKNYMYYKQNKVIN